MHWLALVLIGFAGAYSIFTVGLTGGPSQGDHPFVITVVHCIAFYYYGRHWPALSRELYWSGLVIALLVTFLALRVVGEEPRGGRAAVRIVLGVVYIGLLVVMLWRP